MKKLILGLSAIAVVITGIFTFAGCEKEDGTDKQKEQTKNLSLSFMRADFFDYLGQVYSVADYPELFELVGGNFWYYDADGTKHWYYPYNGNPYFRPPYDQDDSITNPMDIGIFQTSGKFIHNTFKDIMNAHSAEIPSLISANLALPYNPLTSLSAKINENLLTQVANGTLHISRIDESISESDNHITYYYNILFQNTSGATEESIIIEFNYQKGNAVADPNI